MDETRTVKTSHTFWFSDRKKAKVTGVSGILRFDDESVVLDIGEYNLCLEGENLVIESFGKDTGEVEVTGKLDSAYYSEKNERTARRGGLFHRTVPREDT